MSMSALSDELAQVRTKKKEFLAQIERIVPWKEWLVLIQPCYYKGERGNKPYPLETMLRLYLLQNLYDLSDEATAAEAIDSRAFSDFCGVDSSNQVPDGDTIGRFRNLLVKNGPLSRRRPPPRTRRRSGIRMRIRSGKATPGTLATKRISVQTRTVAWFIQ